MEEEPTPITRSRLKKIPKSDLSEADKKNIALINDLKKNRKLEDTKLIKEITEGDYDYLARHILSALLNINQNGGGTNSEPEKPKPKKVVKEIETSDSEEEIVVVKKKKPNITRVEPRPLYAHAEAEPVNPYENHRLIEPVTPRVMEHINVPQPEIKKSRYKNPPNK